MGRPRKKGPRQKDGRLKREGIVETMRPTLERRARMMGWGAGEAALLWARDERLAHLPGRLFRAELMEEVEMLGLLSYGKCYNRYLRSIDAPRSYPACARIQTEGEVCGTWVADIDPDAPDYVRRCADAYMAAESVLIETRAKGLVLEALENAADHYPKDVGHHRLASLRMAGRKLGDHFGWR